MRHVLVFPNGKMNLGVALLQSTEPKPTKVNAAVAAESQLLCNLQSNLKIWYFEYNIEIGLNSYIQGFCCSANLSPCRRRFTCFTESPRFLHDEKCTTFALTFDKITCRVKQIIDRDRDRDSKHKLNSLIISLPFLNAFKNVFQQEKKHSQTDLGRNEAPNTASSLTGHIIYQCLQKLTILYD